MLNMVQHSYMINVFLSINEEELYKWKRCSKKQNRAEILNEAKLLNLKMLYYISASSNFYSFFYDE